MSFGVNICIMGGYLGADPKITDINGTTQVKFTVAITEVWRDKNGAKQERTEWVSVVAWRKSAEMIAQYLRKGDPIHFRGRYRTREFDGDDGKKVRHRYIELDHFDFLPKSKPDDNSRVSNQHPDDPVDDEIPF